MLESGIDVRPPGFGFERGIPLGFRQQNRAAEIGLRRTAAVLVTDRFHSPLDHGHAVERNILSGPVLRLAPGATRYRDHKSNDSRNPVHRGSPIRP